MATIPKNERVPLSEKLAFGAGTGLESLATNMVKNTLWLPFFNLGLGLNAAALSSILMIYTIWDAFTDPLMGHISDNARSRWGRRKPFILVGGITTGLLSMVFWFIPSTLPPWLFYSILTLLGMIFFTSFTTWSMPYYGLQMEMTPNYDERTRLTGWMTGFSKINWLVATMILWVIGKLFTGADGKTDIVTGVRTIAPLFALAGVVLGILPALFVKERYYAAEASKQPREPFWTSIKESVRCNPLWLLIGISFFQVLGGIVVDSLSFYVNMFKVSGGSFSNAAGFEVLKKLVQVGAGLALIPFWIWLAEKWDKKWVVGFLLCMGVVNQGLSYFCLRPDMPYLQLIPAAFQQGVAAAVWLIIPSMKADVADYDELHTGKRREGSLNSFYSWFIKAAVTGAVGITGLIVQHIAGINPKLAVQPPEVIDRLFASYLIIPAVILVVPLYFVWKYPLSRDRMAGIRTQLEARRGNPT
jgi:GPH family glycoside/pentoside/hexuronide:cation symporter